MAHYCLHEVGKYHEFEDDNQIEFLREQPEWPKKFERVGRPILWGLDSDTNDIEGTKKEEAMIEYAMIAWSYETNLQVRKARPGEPVDIKISFKSKADDKMFAKRPTTLAYAYFPGQPNVEGIVVFNDEYLWTVDGKPINAAAYRKITGREVVPGSKYKTFDFQHTCTHELGHTFGLRHEANFSDHIMWPIYNKQRVPKHNDLKRIQDKYGFKKLNVWQKFIIRLILSRGPKV